MEEEEGGGLGGGLQLHEVRPSCFDQQDARVTQQALTLAVVKLEKRGRGDAQCKTAVRILLRFLEA